jgi:phage-related protein
MAKVFEQDARKLEAAYPLVWLVEIEIPTSPDPTRFRATTNNEPVSFGKALDGTGRVYRPFPMQISAITRTKEGDLPQIQVAASNAQGVLTAYLEAYRGLAGQAAVVQLVSLGELANASASLRFDGEIVSSQIDAATAQVSIGAYNADGMQFPKVRHSSEHCRFVFGSPGCGYNLNHPLATFTTCPRTYSACVARGDDEEDVMGVVRLHPERFGGFRGIPHA